MSERRAISRPGSTSSPTVSVRLSRRSPSTPPGEERPVARLRGGHAVWVDFECNPLLTPVFGAVGAVLALVLALLVVAFLRSRNRGYVLAVVDVVHTANLGRGSKLGIAFIRSPKDNRVTGVVANPRPERRRPRPPHRTGPLRGHGPARSDGSRPRGNRSWSSTPSVDASDLCSAAFDTNAASQVSSRR